MDRLPRDRDRPIAHLATEAMDDLRRRLEQERVEELFRLAAEYVPPTTCAPRAAWPPGDPGEPETGAA